MTVLPLLTQHFDPQTDPCGLQLFHLLSHTDGSGGATLLVDGFYVASILKELYPAAYATLTRIGVPAHAAGEPGALYTPFPERAYPVLREHGGELVQVRWNNDDRSVMDHLSATEMEEWCVPFVCFREANRVLMCVAAGMTPCGCGTSSSRAQTRSTGCSSRRAPP